MSAGGRNKDKIDVILCDESAAAYWRSGRPEVRVRQVPSKTTKLPNPNPDTPWRFIDKKVLGLGPGPLHVLVADAKHRRNSTSIRCHIMGVPLPPGSIVDAGNGLGVTSPELTFLMVANVLDIPELVVLGCELCGLYSECDFNEAHLYSRDPLMTPETLRNFLSSASGIHGIKKARRAARYIAARSRSPIESKIYTVLVLPRRLNGSGLPPAELNVEVTLSAAIQRTSQKSHYECDLLWHRDWVKLCIEYNSDTYHNGEKPNADDAEKQAVLESKGYTVIQLTRIQIREDRRFAMFVHVLFHHLRLRDRTPRKTKAADLASRQNALRAKLVRTSMIGSQLAAARAAARAAAAATREAAAQEAAA